MPNDEDELFLVEDYPMRAESAVSDPRLGMLASLVNGGLLTFGIDLYLPSGLLRGLLISRDQWWQEVGEEWTAGGGEAIMKSINAAAKEYGLHLFESDVAPHESPRFLHLRDVELPALGADQYKRLVRVKIADVCGWGFGHSSATIKPENEPNRQLP